MQPRRGALTVAVAVVLAALAWPGVAAGATQKSVSLFPPDLWVTVVWGAAASVVVMVIAIAWCMSPTNRTSWQWSGAVSTASAWDFKDSWVTNLTALATVLTGVFTATSATDFLTTAAYKDSFGVMSLLFGAVAVMAPVVYGIFSKPSAHAKPAPTTDRETDRTEDASASDPAAGASSPQGGGSAKGSPTGTPVGLVLANVVSLVATFGLLADIGLFATYTTATDTEVHWFLGGLALAALLIAAYAVRSTKLMICTSTSLVSSNASGTL